MARETQPDQSSHASEAELAGLRGGLTKKVESVIAFLARQSLTTVLEDFLPDAEPELPPPA